MKKAITVLIVSLFFMFDVWVLASFVEINATNLHEDPSYCGANFFVVLLKEDLK